MIIVQRNHLFGRAVLRYLRGRSGELVRGHELLLLVVGLLSFEQLLVHHVKLLDGNELVVLQVRRIDVIHLEVNIDVLMLMLLILYDLGP